MGCNFRTEKIAENSCSCSALPNRVPERAAETVRLSIERENTSA
jgi:hypothetical protein